MKFELRPTYPNWEGNDRKTLHVDDEAYIALQRLAKGRTQTDLDSVLPPEVVTELQKPMYGPGTGSAAIQLWGMDVVVDPTHKGG